MGERERESACLRAIMRVRERDRIEDLRGNECE